MTAPYQSSLVTHSYSLWDSSFGSLRFDLALSKILFWAKKSGTSSETDFNLQRKSSAKIVVTDGFHGATL